MDWIGKKKKKMHSLWCFSFFFFLALLKIVNLWRQFYFLSYMYFDLASQTERRHTFQL